MEREEVETLRVKSAYDRNARFFDLMEYPVEALFFSKWRKRVAALLPPGKILEVGVGTGKNLKYYRPDFEATAGDISEKMLEKAKEKARQMNLKVDLRVMDAQKLEFKDSSFDGTLSAFTFCSVPDPVKGLKELRRVLKPGGVAVFLEHVQPKSFLGQIFDIINPIVVGITGTNINRNTVENIKKAGFEVEKEENLLLDAFKLIVARRSG